MSTESCVICASDGDVLMACKVCRKHGWCLTCEVKMARCPMCRTSFSSRNVIYITPPTRTAHLDTDELDGETWVEVRRVLEFNEDEGEYLIEWTVGTPTWEAAETIEEDIPEMIDEFWVARNAGSLSAI